MRRPGRAAVVVGALVLSGLGSVGSPARAANASVSISDFEFAPKTVTVNVGDRVVWTNQGPSNHAVQWPDGTPTSPDLAQGESYSRTFSAPTTLEYRCRLHPTMKGTVVVQGSASPSSTSPPTTKAPTATTAKPSTTTTARSGGATATTAGIGSGGINPDAYATGDSSTTTPSSTTSTTSVEELATDETGSSGGGGAAVAIFAAAVVLAAILGALLWRRRGVGPAA